MTRGTSARTLDFADRRGTLETSQTLRKARKSTKIEGTSLRLRFANENIEFCVPGSDMASILAAPKHSRAFPGAPPGVPGRSWEPSGRFRGVPGAPRDASETLLGCLPNALGHHGASREGRGINFESILGAPGQLRAAPGTDLGSIFVIIFASISRASWPSRLSGTQASWPAQGKPRDCQVALASEMACETACTSRP